MDLFRFSSVLRKIGTAARTGELEICAEGTVGALNSVLVCKNIVSVSQLVIITIYN